ncbi:MAG: septation protein IspZ, partial [Spirochaetaceae bacterium]|nr:septation protein IspZ [Spirochaetaceae bacterium]
MNLSRLLKALLPSLVPLLVFVAADALFGEAIGLAVGLAVGVGEFLFVLVRDKRPDPFVAADTLLLAAAGALSLLLENDLFFKLKPAVIELVLGAAFGLLLALPERHLKAYMERQLKGFEFSAAAMPAMRRSLTLMLAILALHIGLTVYAALAMGTAAWGFVSGALLYLLFGLMALVEFLAARRRNRRFVSGAGAALGEAVLPLVDEEGRVLGHAGEVACHAGPGKLHPALSLQVFDEKGRIYLAKRSEAAGPGPWDSAHRRHVAAGEDLEAALAAALREGLGLGALGLEGAGTAPAPLFRYRHEGEGESELVFVYGLRHAGPFAPGEEAERRFWTGEELEAAAASGALAPKLLRELELLGDGAR